MAVGSRLDPKEIRQGAYLGLAKSVVFLAKDAPTQLVDFCPTFPPVKYGLADDAASCCIGVGIRVGVVGSVIHLLNLRVSRDRIARQGSAKGEKLVRVFEMVAYLVSRTAGWKGSIWH